jgi:hypothetical protein
MAMVLAVLEPLRLRYEDRFFADSRSLRRIAEWLGSTVPDCELQRIFEALEAKVVTPRLRSWADELMAAGAAPAAFAEHHDHATQLHPNHIGDGKIGKGRERLPAERFTILSDCLAGFGLEDQWRTRTIKWSGALFRYADDREPQACERLDACGEERLLVYGPYLYLPTGYWRIVPLIQAAYPDVPVQLVADVYTDRRGVLQLRVVTLPACNPHRITLEFEHLNHLDPIEVRLSSVRDGNRTQVIFSGVELRWLGPLDPQPGHSARGVNDRGLLSHPPG